MSTRAERLARPPLRSNLTREGEPSPLQTLRARVEGMKSEAAADWKAETNEKVKCFDSGCISLCIRVLKAIDAIEKESAK